MVAGRADTDTLSSRFQNLLASQGIEISYEADEETSGEDNLSQPQSGEDESGKEKDEEARLPNVRQSRPSSTGSIYEVGSWKTGEDLEEIHAHNRPASRASDPTGIHTRSTAEKRRLLERLSDRGRLNSRSASDTLYNQPKHRAASISSLDSFKLIRKAESDIGKPSRGFSASRDEHDGVARPLPVVMFHPSETQLIADADTFEYHHNVRLLRRVLWQWRDSARVLLDKREKMYRDAEELEYRVVARQAALLFSRLTQSLRAEREKDQAFAARERQIDMDRNFHLMDKAFDHWAAFTREHVERTQLARRHMIRHKYFHAWKNITVINESKLERHLLKKFLRIWKKRLDTVEGYDYLAIDTREYNLAKGALIRLNIQCKARVWEYRADQRLKEAYFRRWLQIVRDRRLVEEAADAAIARYRSRRIFALLHERLRSIRGQQEKAEEFRRQRLTSGSLTTLAIQTKLMPPFKQLSNAVDSRLASSTLRTWNLHAQQSVQAAELDTLRVLRNAFTLWNDRLRCSWLSHRIDDRVAIEALYRLSIASKASIWERVQQRKLLTRSMDHWYTRTRNHTAQIEDAAAKLQSVQERLLMRRAWKQFRASYNSHRYDGARAVEQYCSRRVPVVFADWKARAQMVQHLNQQASAARFYVLTTSTLKRWREATKQSQKHKRREAYATVRRLCKMNLVRRNLTSWREKTESVRRMEQQATEKAEDRTVNTLVGAFNAWRSRNAQVTELSEQAASYRNGVLLRTTFASLDSRFQYLRQMDSRAQSYQAEVAAIAAQKSLTKLGWRLFQVRRLEQNALALKDKHWRSHVKSMLRFWADQAARSRLQQAGVDAGRFDLVADSDDEESYAQDTSLKGFPERGDAHSSETLNEGEDEGPDDHIPSDASMLRAEEWTALDQSALDIRRLKQGLDLVPAGSSADAEGIISSTPMPGYLRTPSKRSTARSKARQRLMAIGSRGRFDSPGEVSEADMSALLRGPSTAPAAAVARGHPAALSESIITPFERKLKAQGLSSRGSSSARAGRLGAFRRGASTSGIPLSAGRGKGSAGFAGFEDIQEDSSGRSGR